MSCTCPSTQNKRGRPWLSVLGYILHVCTDRVKLQGDVLPAIELEGRLTFVPLAVPVLVKEFRFLQCGRTAVSDHGSCQLASRFRPNPHRTRDATQANRTC